MTTSYYADRINLLYLLQQHPDWTQPKLAQALGRSLAWVKKWRRRIGLARARGEPLAEVLAGYSCARKHSPRATDPLVQERILAIRDEPPEGLRRTPGPAAILYYLPRDQQLQAKAVPLPRSSCTIYRILKKHGRIPERRPRQHEPAFAQPTHDRLASRFQRRQYGPCRAGWQAATWGGNAQRPRQWHLGAARCPGESRFHR